MFSTPTYPSSPPDVMESSSDNTAGQAMDDLLDGGDADMDDVFQTLDEGVGFASQEQVVNSFPDARMDSGIAGEEEQKGEKPMPTEQGDLTDHFDNEAVENEVEDNTAEATDKAANTTSEPETSKNEARIALPRRKIKDPNSSTSTLNRHFTRHQEKLEQAQKAAEKEAKRTPTRCSTRLSTQTTNPNRNKLTARRAVLQAQSIKKISSRGTKAGRRGVDEILWNWKSEKMGEGRGLVVVMRDEVDVEDYVKMKWKVLAKKK